MHNLPTYTGETARAVAMSLGGIGTGQVAVRGDGGLDQWQIFNNINHNASLPNTFFALRTARQEPPLTNTRILQSLSARDASAEPGLGSDWIIPAWQESLVERVGGMANARFSGPYPVATVDFDDPAVPLDVQMRAWSPFVPHDEGSSSLPAVVFEFTLRNQADTPVRTVLAACMQNPVGWDGLANIDGSRCALYGGNVNRVAVSESRVDIEFTNANLNSTDAQFGEVRLSALTPNAIPFERWSDVDDFLRVINGNLIGRQPYGSAQDHLRWRGQGLMVGLGRGPSPQGQTWNGSLLVPTLLGPGEETTVTFAITWWFPNRFVNFDQYAWRSRNYGNAQFWLGNQYSERFNGAGAAADFVEDNLDDLSAKTKEWCNLISELTVSPAARELLGAQPSYFRSPTCFVAADGNFFGFEGSLGRSTAMWTGDYGGSCPLNCTHVWNYEQALASLMPKSELTMRDVEYDYMQHPSGFLPHRLVLPLYLPQFWDGPIGGPANPALDGMLGSVLKSYREVRQGAGQAWLNARWESIRRLMDYIKAKWDADGDGVLSGEQPNTFDISFYGKNTFIGTLWLAALRASAAMARAVGDEEFASDAGRLADLGSMNYDNALWNGEYYQQALSPEEAGMDFQWGQGCLADQLLGQWWADLLDLGYLLPRDHVRTALKSIVRYNLLPDFGNVSHIYRAFVGESDAGLAVCTWPNGGRPNIPIRYADEVWLGSEFQLAAHCLMEDLPEGGQLLDSVLARHKGSNRNPYNGIECGDHYSRTMAGWSLVDAMNGVRYNALDGSLKFTRRLDEGQVTAVSIGHAWGSLSGYQHRQELKVLGGSVSVAKVLGDGLEASFAGRGLDRNEDGSLGEAIILEPGGTFSVSWVG